MAFPCGDGTVCILTVWDHIHIYMESNQIEICTYTANAKESEVEQFQEDVQDLLELTHTHKKDVLFIIGHWNAKVRSQEIPGITGKVDLEYKMKQCKG